jgi:hypothetical protein
MELNFFIAKHRHNIYRIVLQAVLLDLDDTSEEKLISKNHCEFCRWVNKYLMSDYKNIPDVEHLLEVHENVHSRAQALIEFKSKEQFEKAKAEFEKIEKLTKTLFSLLDRIENEIKLYNVEH